MTEQKQNVEVSETETQSPRNEHTKRPKISLKNLKTFNKSKSNHSDSSPSQESSPVTNSTDNRRKRKSLSAALVSLLSNKPFVFEEEKVEIVEIEYRGGKYKGQVKDGVPHGKGLIVYKNGDEYDGDWVNGKAHGNGKSKILPKELFDNRISYYEGEWFEDYLHGNGKMCFGNGDVYEGNFEKNKIQGKGKYVFASGEIYNGQWKRNKKHGIGVYIIPTKSMIYQGNWKDDKRHGIGYLIKNPIKKRRNSVFGKQAPIIYRMEYKDDKLIQKQRIDESKIENANIFDEYKL